MYEIRRKQVRSRKEVFESIEDTWSNVHFDVRKCAEIQVELLLDIRDILLQQQGLSLPTDEEKDDEDSDMR